MVETRLWYVKYRPQTLDDYVWSDDRLRGQIGEWIEKKTIPSIMFAGGPGRGKTTLADLIIAQMGVDESDVLRLKGAKDNNAETIRTRVQEFCELGGWSGLRIVFFDEADLLSHTAQGMLRNVIDDNPDVRFIFTCNYPHRIIEALSSSRLVRIDIETLQIDSFTERMVQVLVDEQIDLDDTSEQVIMSIRDTCYPDLRRAINVLQSSVKDGCLRQVHTLKSAAGVWETYFLEIFKNKANPIRTVCKIRETLAAISPDEMEEVYRFLYHNGSSLFGDKQIPAIYIINAGQKVHRAALLPDMILLEVFLKLLVLIQDE